MNILKTLNCKCVLEMDAPIHGMIDGNAYNISPATWPVPVRYVRIEHTENKWGEVYFTNIGELMTVDGKDISHLTTAETGNFLVCLNSRMYNEQNVNNYGLILREIKELTQISTDIKEQLNGRLRDSITNKKERERLEELEERAQAIMKENDLARKDIPSLIIATTMDMEFAHIGGYDGKRIYQQDSDTGEAFYTEHGLPVYLNRDEVLMFQNWKRQITGVEAAVALNPLRLFPLFSYDPRRYRYGENERPAIKGCGTWKEPFARIIGHEDSCNDVRKIWLGFCMNPALGFRPFDEFCEHLPRFYSECEKNDIPILADCVPGGITAYDAKDYPNMQREHVDKGEERHEMITKSGLSSYHGDALFSCMYYGGEQVVGDTEYGGLDYFYRNYGHPRNWIPVLKYFPDLRLCLSGFGGNSEWLRTDWLGDLLVDGNPRPTSQWIRCIIELTAKYENVYADISGLNIYDKDIRSGLQSMLYLLQKEEFEEFKHLKYKLIFGSGWYLANLTDVANGGRSINDGVPISHGYSNYCDEYRDLFYMADQEGDGQLWEHVSLINPWNFYGLSAEKINAIYEELSQNTGVPVNCDMLEKMKFVFDGSDDVAGLVDYIKKSNKANGGIAV